MKTFLTLVKRNMWMYLRNKTSVAFSFLSMMIILGLNIIFLGDVNKEYLQQFITLDKNQVAYIIGSWLMAGIIVVNTVMVILAALGIMIEDEEKHKMAAFLVAPISKITLTLSYIVAACANAFMLSMLTVVFSILYLYMSCGVLISIVTFLKLVGIIIVNIFSLVAFFTCVVTLVHSSSAFSAITTTIGTLIGFVAAIYLPMGSLSENMQNVLKAFPVLYGTAATRTIYTQGAIEAAFKDAPLEAAKAYKTFMGISIKWGTQEVGMLLCLLILIGSGIIFTLIAGWLLSHKKASDR